MSHTSKSDQPRYQARTRRGDVRADTAGHLRFALYARTSTDDLQDPETSFGWQKDVSESVVMGAGRIEVEFWDRDTSRSVRLEHRPEGRSMFIEMVEADRRFDAIVVGEAPRVFGSPGQVEYLVDMCRYHKVELWIGRKGRIDLNSPSDKLQLIILGSSSEQERQNTRERVTGGMTAIAKRESRFLGGRTPYGYTLVPIVGPDGQPTLHRNPKKAHFGMYLQTYAPDPKVAGVVSRIFHEFVVERRGYRAIAQRLTDDGIPSPSAYRPEQNQRRDRTILKEWSPEAIRAILVNPIYTGQRVWGKQRRESVLNNPLNPNDGTKTLMRWNNPADWIRPVDGVPGHPPLVTEAAFAAVQAMIKSRQHRREERGSSAHGRPYPLRGRVRCEVCNRKMEASRPHGPSGQTYYKCRVAARWARSPETEQHHPSTGQLRESVAMKTINQWMATTCNRKNLDVIVDLYMAKLQGPTEDPRVEAARRRLAEADQKIRNCEAMLGQVTDIAQVVQWLETAQATKAAVEAELAALPKRSRPPARDEIIGPVRAFLADLEASVRKLATADPEVTAAIYAALGVEVLYTPGAQELRVILRPGVCGDIRVSEGGVALYPHASDLRFREAGVDLESGKLPLAA